MTASIYPSLPASPHRDAQERKRKSIAALDAQVNAWNALHPIGSYVSVTKDNGDVLHTLTRSPAYVLSGHSAVIMVNGISGCYLLDRVNPQ